MGTIETTATVTEDGQLIVPAPPDLPVGKHRVVVVIEGLAPEATLELLAATLDLPIHDIGPWPFTLSLRREGGYLERGLVDAILHALEQVSPLQFEPGELEQLLSEIEQMREIDTGNNG